MGFSSVYSTLLLAAEAMEVILKSVLIVGVPGQAISAVEDSLHLEDSLVGFAVAVSLLGLASSVVFQAEEVAQALVVDMPSVYAAIFLGTVKPL